MARVTELSDSDLVELTRSGDRSAFAELWRRHAHAGKTVARAHTSTFDADDLIAEAYTKIFQAISRGHGPTGSFRAYLFTTIRSVAASWGRRVREAPIDDAETLEDPAFSEDRALIELDRSLTATAFRSLPTRWQEVLWYCEVESMKPADVAPLLGMSANSVAALAYRAREGLRQAWVQAHIASAPEDSDCRWTTERLGAYSRDGLGKRDRAKVDAHLLECTRCAIVAEEAKEVGSRLALVMLPLTVGIGGTAAYVAWTQTGANAVSYALGSAGAAMPASVLGGSGATAGAAAGAGTAAAGASGGAGSGGAAGGAGAGAAGGASGATITAVAVGGVLAAAAIAGAVVLGPGLLGGGPVAAENINASPGTTEVSPAMPQPAPQPAPVPTVPDLPEPPAPAPDVPEPTVPIPKTDLAPEVASPAPPSGAANTPTTPAPVSPVVPPVTPPVDPPVAPVEPPLPPDLVAEVDGTTISADALELSGTAAPGATVRLLAGTTVLGSTVASADGSWSSAFPIDGLEDGEWTLSLVQVVSGRSSEPVPVRITVERTVLPPTVDVDTGGGAFYPIVSGTAKPGATVEVFDGSTLRATVVAEPDGTWTTDVLEMAGLDYSITARQTDVLGNVSSASDTIEGSLQPLTIGATVSGIRVVLTGTGAPGARVVLQADGVVYQTVSGVVAADGTFEVGFGWNNPGDHIIGLIYDQDGRRGPATLIPITITG